MTAEQAQTLETADILEIMAMLPHRYPFLMVDRIIEIDGNNSAVGIKNVTYNEPQFMGHFPAQPVMPGVLIIEAMAQTAGVISTRVARDGAPEYVYFLTIDNAKFRKPVVPGDQIRIAVTKLKERGSILKYRCVATVDGDKVAEGDLSAMLGPVKEDS